MPQEAQKGTEMTTVKHVDLTLNFDELIALSCALEGHILDIKKEVPNAAGIVKNGLVLEKKLLLYIQDKIEIITERKKDTP